jgi:hypothetical protein
MEYGSIVISGRFWALAPHSPKFIHKIIVLNAMIKKFC